jgi:hypothetical protein
MWVSPVVSRWQVRPSKKPFFASVTKLATACGAFLPSSVMPSLVELRVSVPVQTRFSAADGGGAVAVAVGVGVGVAVVLGFGAALPGPTVKKPICAKTVAVTTTTKTIAATRLSRRRRATCRPCTVCRAVYSRDLRSSSRSRLRGVRAGTALLAGLKGTRDQPSMLGRLRKRPRSGRPCPQRHLA